MNTAVFISIQAAKANAPQALLDAIHQATQKDSDHQIKWWAGPPDSLSQTGADLSLSHYDGPLVAQLKSICQQHQIDINVLPRQFNWRDFGLIAMDMDSTLINIECIDEMADLAGKKNEVAAITEASMRGEITDFSASLAQRLALLANMPERIISEVIQNRLKLNPGVLTMIQAAKAHGLKTVLVSGGFTAFAKHVQTLTGIDEVYANHLEIIDGKITGRTVGDVVTGDFKAKMVLASCQKWALTPDRAITVGDGSNDLPMMGISGLSVAYHAKPKVKDQAIVAFDHVGLDGLHHLLSPH